MPPKALKDIRDAQHQSITMGHVLRKVADLHGLLPASCSLQGQQQGDVTTASLFSLQNFSLLSCPWVICPWGFSAGDALGQTVLCERYHLAPL